MDAFEQFTKIPIGKKIAVLVLFMVLLGVAFWYVLYQDLMDDLVSLQQAQISLQNKLKEKTHAKQRYDDNRKRRDKLKDSYAAQIRALPPDTEMSSFLASLNTQAELVGLEILRVKPMTEEMADYYARIPVALSLKGTYHQLAKAFYLIGNLDRIINIENLDFAVVGAEESGVSLEANVLATTFRSVDKNSSKSPEKKKKRH